MGADHLIALADKGFHQHVIAFDVLRDENTFAGTPSHTFRSQLRQSAALRRSTGIRLRHQAPCFLCCGRFIQRIRRSLFFGTIRNGKTECGALALFGFDPDPAADLLDDHLRNSQSQTGTGSEAVQFDKAVEDPLLSLCGHSDAGIRNIKLYRISHHIVSKADFAVVRKFNCVAEQVRDHLGQAVMVALDLDIFVATVEDQFHSVMNTPFMNFILLTAQAVEAHVCKMKLEGAGLDLRQVEDIVDQLQQQIGIAVYDIGIQLNLFGVFSA